MPATAPAGHCVSSNLRAPISTLPLPVLIIIELPVADWNKVMNTQDDVVEGKNVTLKFIKRNSQGDLQLSIAALTITTSPFGQ